MIELQIDTSDLERLARGLDATEKQASAALGSTVGKLASWLRTQSLRGLSKEVKVPQKELRRRLKTLKLHRQQGRADITLWYGLDPIGLIYLKAKKDAGNTGIRASGGRFVKSAFIASGRGGSKRVFKRTGKPRLPITEQKASIEKEATAYLEGDLLKSSEFEARFLKTFEHELKWRMRTR